MKITSSRLPLQFRFCILSFTLFFLVAFSLAHSSAQTNGEITGVVTNGTTGQPVPGIEVTLTAFRTEGVVGESTATTNADGSFTFSGVDTADGIVYAASVSYLNVLYSTGMIRFQGATGQSGAIEVFETTDDRSVVRIRSRGIVLSEIAPESGEASILDIFSVDVAASQTFVAGDDGRSLEFPVPRNAGLVTPLPGFDFGTPTIENAVVFATSALRPEGGSATLSYPVPYTGTSFSIETRNAYPTETMRVLAPTDLVADRSGIEVTAPGFQDEGVAMIGEREYRVWTATALEADSSLRITFASLPRSAFEPNELRVLEPAVIAGLALVLAAAATVWFVRHRNLSAVAPAIAGPMPQDIVESREELVIQLHELQDEHDNGQIDDDLYLSERRTLLERLRNVSQQMRDAPVDEA